MNALKTQTLRACAQAFLKTWPFMQELASFGDIHFTGSYALDTMTWPDIDLELQLTVTTPTPSEILGRLATMLFADKRVSKVDYRNFTDHIKPGMTRGNMLGIKVLDEALRPFGQGLYWKVDLWLLEDAEPSRQFMEKLFAQMTPAHKELIMHYKNMWTKAYGRPPQMASYFLYQAVVFEGLKEEADILQYLRR
jgi:hypothetical protein